MPPPLLPRDPSPLEIREGDMGPCLELAARVGDQGCLRCALLEPGEARLLSGAHRHRPLSSSPASFGSEEGSGCRLNDNSRCEDKKQINVPPPPHVRGCLLAEIRGVIGGWGGVQNRTGRAAQGFWGINTEENPRARVRDSQFSGDWDGMGRRETRGKPPRGRKEMGLPLPAARFCIFWRRRKAIPGPLLEAGGAGESRKL